MLAQILQRLVDEKLTTVKEIADLTDRGESTVYRWLSGTSQPDFSEMRHLAQNLNHPTARRRLVELFISGLPVVLHWHEEAEQEEAHRFEQTDRTLEALDAALMALETLSEVLSQERRMLRMNRITSSAASQTVPLIDDTIRHLTLSKNLLVHEMIRRQKAR